jgi:hypothetical protein
MKKAGERRQKAEGILPEPPLEEARFFRFVNREDVSLPTAPLAVSVVSVAAV